MKPDPSVAQVPARPAATPPRAPSQITTKKMLWAMAVLYALWLIWMAYVAWVNVQAGNQ